MQPASARKPPTHAPETLPMTQEMQSLYRAKNEAAISKYGGNPVVMSLADYQNAGLDVAAGCMVGVWLKWKSKSTAQTIYQCV